MPPMYEHQLPDGVVIRSEWDLWPVAPTHVLVYMHSAGEWWGQFLEPDDNHDDVVRTMRTLNPNNTIQLEELNGGKR